MGAMYVVFPAAIVTEFGRDLGGGWIKFKCNFGAKVCKAMGWEEPHEKETISSLEGELSATRLILTPSQKELQMHAIDVEVSKVSGFKCVRLELEGQRGNGYRRELRFEASFSAAEIAGKLEQYLLTCGESYVWTLRWCAASGAHVKGEGILLRTKDFEEYCAVVKQLTRKPGRPAKVEAA